jgi:hypothetical protein
MKWRALGQAVLATLAVAIVIGLGGCKGKGPLVADLVIIRYQQPLSFAVYRERVGLPQDMPFAGGVFTAFKILSIQNTDQQAAPFKFDPAKVRIRGYEGQLPTSSSALQVPYATRPARPVLVRPGQIFNLSDIGGGIIFKVGPVPTNVDLRYERFTLVYAEPDKHILFQPTPTADAEYQPLIEQNDLAQRGI